mmetsp:Transcript_21927/g.61283  ORF Transcript_21927/g.61283 Transcript_21927/m.61283 type:complete len:219 (-) Transcript_21927:154-810(-)
MYRDPTVCAMMSGSGRGGGIGLPERRCRGCRSGKCPCCFRLRRSQGQPWWQQVRAAEDGCAAEEACRDGACRRCVAPFAARNASSAAVLQGIGAKHRGGRLLLRIATSAAVCPVVVGNNATSGHLQSGVAEADAEKTDVARIVLAMVFGIILLVFLICCATCLCSCLCLLHRGVPERHREAVVRTAYELERKGYLPKLNESPPRAHANRQPENIGSSA